MQANRSPGKVVGIAAPGMTQPNACDGNGNIWKSVFAKWKTKSLRGNLIGTAAFTGRK
jgi:hypothetical protein